MSHYNDYLTYRIATDQIRERVEQRQRSRAPGRRRQARASFARGLHSLADRLEG